jgi:predicted TIM-barrel fold metal-dependent hydrolase
VALRIQRHRRLARAALRAGLIAVLAGAAEAAGNNGDRLPALADVHQHYKWNQVEVTSVDDAVERLREQNIGLAVVTGTPPELALELAEAAPGIVVPIYGIYRTSGEWSRWPSDEGLVERVRSALATGRYRGIGEVHMIGGFIPKWDQPVIAGLFSLAAEFDVPVLLHTEFSRANYLVGICRAYPDTRFLWAHAGTMVPPDEVDRALAECPNIWVELSARDPWRYVHSPIADGDNRLLPPWRRLVLKWQDRFMVGSDPVWPVEQLDAWDSSDTGWHELGRFVGFHRQWLDDLPVEAAEKIRWTNAMTFFAQRDAAK